LGEVADVLVKLSARGLEGGGVEGEVVFKGLHQAGILTKMLVKIILFLI
jgi:hypothetical protein